MEEISTNLTPEEFQLEVAKEAQRRLAESMGRIAPPKTVRDVAAWFEIMRKAAGLDNRQRVVAIGILPAARSVPRRKVTAIDAELADPLDGFEV